MMLYHNDHNICNAREMAARTISVQGVCVDGVRVCAGGERCMVGGREGVKMKMTNSG